MASTDPAHSDALSAALIPLGSHANAAPIDIKRPITVIGSRKEIVRLHLQSSTISKAHCVIVLNRWGCYVHDLGSRTGTLVNGKAIADIDLADGDVLQVGRFQFKYRAPKNAKPKAQPLPPAEVSISTLAGKLQVNKRVLVVGRRSGADIEFSDSRVSNIHALIVEQDGRRLVRDLASRTGTWLDDQPVHQEPLADGAALKVGGATISIADRPSPAARGADSPITLADAAPAAAAATGFGVAVADLAPLELEADEDEAKPFRPDDTLPAADDLASLRREWQAPARPAEPARPTAEAPAEVPAESEVTDDLLPLEPAEETPAAEPPVAETPVEIDLAKAEAAAEAELDLDEADLDDLDLIEPEPAQPAQVEPAEPVAAESPAAEAPAQPAVEPVAEVAPNQLDGDEEVSTEPLADAPLDDLLAETESEEPLDIEALAEQELGLGLAAPSAAEAEAEALAEKSVEAPAEPESPEAELLLSDAPDTVSDTEVQASESLAEKALTPLSPAEKPAPLPLDADAPLAGAAAPAVDELRLDPDAPTAPAEVTDGVIAVTPLPPELTILEPIAEMPADVSVTPEAVAETTPEAEAEVDLEPLDLEELDLSDLHLEPDPAAPGAVAEADVDALTLDPDAPAADLTEVVKAEALEVSDTTSDTIVHGDAAVTTVAETPSADLIDLSADLAAADAERTAVPIGEQTLVDLAPPTEEAASADTVNDPLQPATANEADNELIVGRLADLEPADEDEPLEFVVESPTGAAANDSIVADSLVADAAAADLAPADATPGDTLKLDTNAAPAAFVPPEEPPVEPDHIRLEDDLNLDEEADDATALAVDLGLVLEDDHDLTGLHAIADATPRQPAPADPVDINLADARPVVLDGDSSDSIDLSHLGPQNGARFTPSTTSEFAPAAEQTSEDIFDADDIELIEPDAAAAQPSAESLGTSPAEPEIVADAPKESPKAEDIRPPSGGSLRDLMPGGPPLLGGSFMSMPPAIPSVPRVSGPADRGPKARPNRVGFGTPPRGRRAAPFAADRTIADAMGGVDADDTLDELVSQAPSIDAFSGAPATPVVPPASARAAAPNGQADALIDADGETLDDAAVSSDDTLVAPPERHRPRGTIRPVVLAPTTPSQSPGQSPGLTPTFSPNAGILASAPMPVAVIEQDPQRVRLHKKRVRRVIALLVTMLVLIGGVAWAVYTYMPVLASVDALIQYDGMSKLGMDQQKSFQAKLDALLTAEQVRQDAIQNLPQDLKDVGFLASGTTIYEKIVRDQKVRWPSDQPDTMRLRVRSADKQTDESRVRALAIAMISAAGQDKKVRDQLIAKRDEAERLVALRKSQINDIADQQQALEQASQKRGPAKDKAALTAEYLAAEPALTQIKSKRQELEAEIVRLKLPVAQTQQTANIDPAATDDELANLTKQLNDLQQPAPRPENTAAGADARKKLDETIAQFQSDLAAAGKMSNNPELSAYVESANSMFAQFRQLTEGFIRRQENTRQRLTELKATLSDKQQARTQAIIEADADLKKLKDNLAILDRQRNAAESQGFPEDVKKSDLEMRLLKVKIAEREDKARNDTGFGEAITGIQSVIDQSEKELAIDRRSIDERLTALQNDFVKNGPGGVSLTADQKKLAEGFQAKLAAMNEARRAYDAAAEKAQQDAKAAELASAQKVNELRLQIAARRQDVLAAVKARQAEQDESARKIRLVAAEKELADVRQQEQAGQARVTAALAAMEQAEKIRRLEVTADAERQDLALKRTAAERDRAAAKGTVDITQAELTKLIVPENKPTINTYDDVDRRHLIAALAAGGIALLMLIPIIMDLLALAREHHPHPLPASTAPGFEPTFTPAIEQDREHKALPEPASV